MSTDDANASPVIDGEVAVAITALLNLVRLMGAELVAGKHRDDVELLARAIETKIDSVQLPEQVKPDIGLKGIQLTRNLLAPILINLRERSEVAQLRDRLFAAPASSTMQ